MTWTTRLLRTDFLKSSLSLWRVHDRYPETGEVRLLSSLSYSDHTPEDWDEELALECQLQNHPKYKSFLDQ